MTRFLPTLAAGCAATLSAQFACATLVMHWTLDGASPYTESVSGNNTVTVDSTGLGVNLPTSGQAGITPDGGTSVLFANDGGGHISAGTIRSSDSAYVPSDGTGTDTDFVSLSNWSVTSWVRLSDPQTSTGDRIILSNWFNSSVGFMVGVTGGSRSVFVDFGNTRHGTGITLDLDKDYFIGVVRDPSGGTDTVGGGTNRNRISVYDVAADTWITAEGVQNKNMRLYNMTIGAFANNLDQREWIGLIDDVRVYDQSLTTEELMALANPGPAFDPADLDQDGDVDDADFGIAFAAFTGPNAGPSNNPAADLDGDGDVDDADFGIAFAAFTGPGGGAASVPEPASLALLGLGGLMIARRRRD